MYVYQAAVIRTTEQILTSQTEDFIFPVED